MDNSHQKVVKSKIELACDETRSLYPFHLAFPVTDLVAARTFYGELLGCLEGRSSAEWIDFSLYGHQIVAHLVKSDQKEVNRSEVDGHQVPVRIPHQESIPIHFLQDHICLV